MQDSFRQLWRGLAADEPEPIDDPGDFGFYDVDGIREWGMEYYLSGRNPGHLPKPGWLLMQSASVQHDLRLWLHGIAWAQWQTYRDRKDAEEAALLTENYTT